MLHLPTKKKNQGNNEEWNDIIEKETDEMVEDSPIIIAGSEEKRSVQLHRQKIIRDLVLAGEKFVFKKNVIEESVKNPNLSTNKDSKNKTNTCSFNMSSKEESKANALKAILVNV